MEDPLLFARAVHFAATIMTAGVVFFIVFIAEPAFRKAPNDASTAADLWSRLAWIAWISLALCVLSGAAWFILTAASMSGRPIADVFSQGVIWTVLAQSDFGNDWSTRFVIACVLAAVLIPFLSVEGGKSQGAGSQGATPQAAKSAWLRAAAVVLAASVVGSLAFAGHAIGGEGVEGIVHPAADVLHLIAVAVWVGTLVPLALLLSLTKGPDALAVARSATLRFSTLGIISIATILFTGMVNTWYLVGSIAALAETEYGRLLTIKIALFAFMVAIASINRLWLTPRLVENPSLDVAHSARRALCRNAALEAALGALVIAIVAVLGTLAPASHANHHAIEGAIPADASFQHIHSEHGMADVTIEPGRVGTASVTIHLLDDDLETLAARTVTLTLTAPTAASTPIRRAAAQGADGEWHVDGIELSEPGNWTVTLDAVLLSQRRLQLVAPIVINAN